MENDGTRPNSNKHYLNSPIFIRLRSLLMERTGGVCQVCRHEEATEVYFRHFENLRQNSRRDVLAVCSECRKDQKRARQALEELHGTRRRTHGHAETKEPRRTRKRSRTERNWTQMEKEARRSLKKVADQIDGDRRHRRAAF